jgi:hypothetical protein
MSVAITMTENGGTWTLLRKISTTRKHERISWGTFNFWEN